MWKLDLMRDVFSETSRAAERRGEITASRERTRLFLHLGALAFSLQSEAPVR